MGWRAPEQSFEMDGEEFEKFESLEDWAWEIDLLSLDDGVEDVGVLELNKVAYTTRWNRSIEGTLFSFSRREVLY